MARGSQWRRLRADHREALRRIAELERGAEVRREALRQAGLTVGVLQRDYRALEDKLDALRHENGLLREALHESRAREKRS